MKKTILITILALALLSACANTGSGGGAGDAVSAKEEFFNTIKQLPTEYMVSYNILIQDYESTITMYVKDQNLRVDASNEQGNALMLMTPNQAVNCAQANNEWSCFKIESDQIINPVTQFKELYEKAEMQENVEITRDGNMKIATITAPCYKIHYNTSEVDVIQRACLSNEGVILYAKNIVGEQTVAFEATDYNSKVSNDIFKIPEDAKMMDFGS
ncbi:hypothetical protein GOV04_05175 [Candidatus Woesearchaeota archaeon]|nr:hypothetical protein [Candidatus Woesearchaeota archaeon]